MHCTLGNFLVRQFSSQGTHLCTMNDGFRGVLQAVEHTCIFVTRLFLVRSWADRGFRSIYSALYIVLNVMLVFFKGAL